MSQTDTQQGALAGSRSRAFDYLALTKPQLTLLSVGTAVGGAYLASGSTIALGRLGAVFLGTALVGAACGAVNQYREREHDAQMKRTERRPLPAQRISPRVALAFGVVLMLLGVGTLLLWTTPLAALLALVTFTTYIFLYTPLKRITPFATIIGGIPGALPPLIGWTAVTGEASMGGWSLFFILFFWQMPHFLALAWMYRGDYAHAQYRMLSVLDETGIATSRQALIYAIALVPASVMPSLVGLAGIWHFCGAFMLSLWFLRYAIAFARFRTDAHARRLFFASLSFLPFVFFLLLFDRILRS